MTTLAPALLAGRFRLLRPIGSGGFGTVYLASDRAGARVAIKILSQRHAADAEHVRRFRREAAVGREIAHPNVVRVLDCGVDGDRHYLVMEWVDGCSLAEYLDRHGPLAPAQAIALLRQVLRGLAEIHRQGICLLDFKPSNVLVEPRSGTAKIADFGTAQALGEPYLLHGEFAIGTPPYMSPEQRAGKALGPEADLYAVGCVLYEMLTGSRLIRPDGQPAENAAEAALAGLRAAGVTISPDLAAAMYQALCRDPLARFHSAAEMERAIASDAPSGRAPRTTTVRRATTPELAPPASRRNGVPSLAEARGDFVRALAWANGLDGAFERLVGRVGSGRGLLVVVLTVLLVLGIIQHGLAGTLTAYHAAAAARNDAAAWLLHFSGAPPGK